MDNQNRTAEDIRCSVCGDPCLERDRGVLQGSCPSETGARAHYLAHLCQGCFLGALSYLRQEHEIMNLFDYEPIAGETFGLVIEHKKQPRP